METPIVKFLLARIDEDEAVARSAARGPWLCGGGAHDAHVYAPEVRTSKVALFREDVIDRDYALSLNDAEHIARHDPARVLAECAAKRRIVSAFEHGERLVLEAEDMAVFSDLDRARLRGERNAMHAATIWLAEVYAEHPDFDPAWRL